MKNNMIRRLAEVARLLDESRYDDSRHAVQRAQNQIALLSEELAAGKILDRRRRGFRINEDLVGDMITDADHEDDSYVFVYGTLKTGYGNNHILYNAEFVDVGTVYDYGLIDGGFPYAIYCEGMQVNGEVYLVKDQHTMDRLDMLEGYPTHYTRDYVQVDTERGVFNAWMYVAAMNIPHDGLISEWTR